MFIGVIGVVLFILFIIFLAVISLCGWLKAGRLEDSLRLVLLKQDLQEEAAREKEEQKV